MQRVEWKSIVIVIDGKEVTIDRETDMASFYTHLYCGCEPYSICMCEPCPIELSWIHKGAKKKITKTVELDF